MDVIPMKERVLIKVSKGEGKTSSGLYIPESAQEKTNEGTVIAVGECEKCNLKKGDRVIYDKYAGTEVKIDGEEHIILNIKDVLAKIEK